MAHYSPSRAFAIIILQFGWLLDWAYGLITLATQIRTLMGIHWAFTGTYLGTVDLTCIAHPCSDTYGCTCRRKTWTYAALAAARLIGRDGRGYLMGECVPWTLCCRCTNLVGAIRYRARMVWWWMGAWGKFVSKMLFILLAESWHEEMDLLVWVVPGDGES